MSLRALLLSIAVMMPALHGRAAAAPCTIRGVPASLRVNVQPVGQRAFDVELVDQPVELVLRGAAIARARVAGTLAFEGTADDTDVRLARGLTVAHGMLQLRQGAWLSELRQVAGAVLASVVLEGRIQPDDVDERVSPVQVPCDALILSPSQVSGDMQRIKPGTDLGAQLSDLVKPGQWWRVLGREVRIHAEPRTGAPGAKVVARCQGCLRVREIESRGSWLLVERDTGDATLTGWIQRRVATRVSSGDASSGALGSAGLFGLPPSEELTDDVDVYEGPARIAAGARVCLADGAGCWATVVHSVEMRVRHRVGEPWVELIAIPGVSPTWRMFVPVAAVALPGRPGQ